MSNTNNNMQTQTSSALYNDTVTSCLVSKIKKSNDFKRRIKVKQFIDTLLQHMGNVKKSVAERTHQQRQYERKVNKRQMQMQESKVDAGTILDDDLVVTESSGTESEMQDESSTSWNDTNVDDADIRPIYDEEPMAE
nr:hypothetical protein [Tanacetum cinerariifolium]